MPHSEQFFSVISSLIISTVISFLHLFLQFPVFRDDLDTFAGYFPKQVNYY
jgi:hypothetical protein